MEKQTARRCRRACGGTRARGENALDLVGREMAAACVEHRSDEITNHVMEEAIATNAINKQIACLMPMLLPLRGKDRADSRSRRNIQFGRIFMVWTGRRAVGDVWVGRGEAFEIVFALEFMSRGLKRAEIQRPWAAVDVASNKGRAVWALQRMRYS